MDTEDCWYDLYKSQKDLIAMMEPLEQRRLENGLAPISEESWSFINSTKANLKKLEATRPEYKRRYEQEQ